MVVELNKGLYRSIWSWARGSKLPLDLAGLPFLGAVAYLLFRHAAALRPLEGALLVVATAGFLRAGLHWWGWHQRLLKDGPLLDWVQRILQGERQPLQALDRQLPKQHQVRQVAEALNAVLLDLQEEREELADLRRAHARDWRHFDTLLASIQEHRAKDQAGRLAGKAQLETLGRDLKTAIEDTLRLDQIELNYRLRADQFRLQGQAFRSTLDQVRAGLDQFENLLEELKDSFPRLRREEDALGRLADAGMRQGARLSLSVKGLVAHTPRLVDETQARTEWLRRLRLVADGARDRTEALARRMEGFREEAQARIRAFGGAMGGLKELDHVAQQTGLLAVNAAILAQRDGGSAGMAEIGARLRLLADQTSEGTAAMGRTLEAYQQGLERETAGLWDLQEVAQNLLADIHELLRTSGQLDRQGHDLERALETHLGMADELRQASERAELSLQEVGARAMALEAAHGRQWGVEAKLAPERERLARMGMRLAEVGDGLAHISQQNIDEIWEILARHQEVRKTDAYRQVTGMGLPQIMDEPAGAKAAWNGIAWARSHRRSLLFGDGRSAYLPYGYLDDGGAIHLRLLGQDALYQPEPSALEAWSCDTTGQIWELSLLESLRTESHRLTLLSLLKESPVAGCFPGMELRITPNGAQLRLPHPYPGLPAFLAGLGLELPLESDQWGQGFRALKPLYRERQGLLWLGPGQGGGVQNQCIRLVHEWVGDDHHHEYFLPSLPYQGHRPPCPWLGDGEVPERLEIPLAARCAAFGSDASGLRSFHQRLLEAGATEGTDGAVFCAVPITHPHPEALLLRLFQADTELAGAFHPDLVPYQMRLREEVLAGTGDPYQAAWSLLEDLQREGWVLPLTIA